MNHQERRTLLQQQHLRLRELIAQVRARAEGALAGDSAGSAELRPQIGTLSAELEAHMTAEEALLGPVLERIDAWGPVRLDLMRAEHAHQRAVLAVLRSDRTVPIATPQLAQKALALVQDILADMDAEDRDLLDPRVLSDDVIQLDASDC